MRSSRDWEAQALMVGVKDADYEDISPMVSFEEGAEIWSGNPGGRRCRGDVDVEDSNGVAREGHQCPLMF